MVNKSILPALRLSMELTDVLTDIERAGIKISKGNLSQIREDYEKEYSSLYNDLMRIVEEVMGDTPINLDSPDDRSMLFYSRKVSDKAEWKKIFNIGFELRGNTKKQKRRTKMRRADFVRAVKDLAPVALKTVGTQCSSCRGLGSYRYRLKSGDLSKNKTKCKMCKGCGVIYTNVNQAAGLKLKPRGPEDTAAGGFKTDKETLEQRLLDLDGTAKVFAEKYMKYSKIRTYLNTFVDSLEKFQDEKGFIHPQFMQCVTSTGRLSSRTPNFQNMPRGSTFPARKAIVSRFNNGYILEGDYRQLEFRVAGFLSGDAQIYEDVKNGVDVHSYTAEIMGVDRQAAKAHTFKPLYGGILGNEKETRYYSAFKKKYLGVADWHERLQREAVSTKKVVLPSGREYAFPYAEFNSRGNVAGSTSIKNYPVQGFATADILPIALIKLSTLLRSIIKPAAKSVIINTVHDSIIMDVHPDEKDQMIYLLKEAMLCIKDEAHLRFGILFDMPIDIELKIGHDWLNLKEIDINDI